MELFRCIFRSNRMTKFVAESLRMVIFLGHVKRFQSFTSKSCFVAHHSSGNLSHNHINTHNTLFTTSNICVSFLKNNINRCWRLFMIKLWNHGLVDASTINNCNSILQNCHNNSETNSIDDMDVDKDGK